MAEHVDGRFLDGGVGNGQRVPTELVLPVWWYFFVTSVPGAHYSAVMAGFTPRR